MKKKCYITILLTTLVIHHLTSAMEKKKPKNKEVIELSEIAINTASKKYNESGRTLLQDAAYWGKLGDVLSLLDAGHDPEESMKFYDNDTLNCAILGTYAQMGASNYIDNSEKIIKHLIKLKYKKDPKLKTTDKKTGLTKLQKKLLRKHFIGMSIYKNKSFICKIFDITGEQYKNRSWVN